MSWVESKQPFCRSASSLFLVPCDAWTFVALHVIAVEEDDIPFSILNKGFVGPTPVHVIQMYLEVFRTADDASRLGTCAAFPGVQPFNCWGRNGVSSMNRLLFSVACQQQLI